MSADTPMSADSQDLDLVRLGDITTTSEWQGPVSGLKSSEWRKWTVSDVSTWLTQNGFKSCVDGLVRDKIDGKKLKSLKDSYFAELGVTKSRITELRSLISNLGNSAERPPSNKGNSADQPSPNEASKALLSGGNSGGVSAMPMNPPKELVTQKWKRNSVEGEGLELKNSNSEDNLVVIQFEGVNSTMGQWQIYATGITGYDENGKIDDFPRGSQAWAKGVKLGWRMKGFCRTPTEPYKDWSVVMFKRLEAGVYPFCVVFDTSEGYKGWNWTTTHCCCIMCCCCCIAGFEIQRRLNSIMPCTKDEDGMMCCCCIQCDCLEECVEGVADIGGDCMDMICPCFDDPDCCHCQ